MQFILIGMAEGSDPVTCVYGPAVATVEDVARELEVGTELPAWAMPVAVIALDAAHRSSDVSEEVARVLLAKLGGYVSPARRIANREAIDFVSHVLGLVCDNGHWTGDGAALRQGLTASVGAA